MTSCWDCMCKKCAFSSAVRHKPTNSSQRYMRFSIVRLPRPDPLSLVSLLLVHKYWTKEVFCAASPLLSSATEERTIKLLIHFNYLCCLKSFFPDAAWNFSAAMNFEDFNRNFKFAQKTQRLAFIQGWKFKIKGKDW